MNDQAFLCLPLRESKPIYEVIKLVREIVRDPIFLARRSAPAGAEDLDTARDLLDTLIAHREGCVGMAANMIGVSRRIILSLSGTRKTKRYRSIKVRYQNEQLQMRLRTFSGWTAQIIQHEIDHCNGILI